MNKFGELIEALISLKDMHRGEFTRQETDTINNACNTLEALGNKEALN